MKPKVEEAKLAEPLRDMAEKVAGEGKDSNPTIGKLSMVAYRIDMMISLRDLSPVVLEALKKLSFAQTGEIKEITMLIGAVDARKLAEFAEIEEVIRIAPVAR